MPLTKRDIEDFATFWHEEFGEQLSEDYARDAGEQLLELFAVLNGPDASEVPKN